MAPEFGINPRCRRNYSLRPRALAVAYGLCSLAIGLPALAAESARDAATRVAAVRWGVPEVEIEVIGEAVVDEVTRVKVFHPKTGKISGVDLDAERQEVPASVVERQLAVRRGAGFIGKKEKALVRKAESDPTGTTSVVVWAKTSGLPPRLSRSGDGDPLMALEAFKEHHRVSTRSLRELAERQGWMVEYQAHNAPLIVLEVPNGELDTLEKRGDVDTLYLARVYEDELNSSTAAIDAQAVWSRGFTGSGVITAVVEGGGIYYPHTYLADGQYCKSSPLISPHTTQVAGIIASTHPTYRGVAYGGPAVLSGNTANAQGNSTESDIIACTEWAISRSARVINYSFGVDEADSSGLLNGLDRYVDYVVRYRAITIVKSAGNNSGFVTSPGRGWNVITVGNYDDRNTAGNSDDIMHPSSSFQDPVSLHSDREKPEVSAPGTGIQTTTYCSDCSSTSTNTAPAGTSFAAPHVTGCAALMMQRKPALKTWPESVKAVLMATSVVNLEGETRLSDVDGAGGIECDAADDVLRGVSGGERHETLYLSHFPRLYTFNATAGQTVRVAIAWDSNTSSFSGSAPTTDVLEADLELVVWNPSGGYVIASGTRDNSFEIVEFTATQTGSYTAEVYAFRFNGQSEHLGFAWWAGTREDN